MTYVFGVLAVAVSTLGTSPAMGEEAFEIALTEEEFYNKSKNSESEIRGDVSGDTRTDVYPESKDLSGPREFVVSYKKPHSKYAGPVYYSSSLASIVLPSDGVLIKSALLCELKSGNVGTLESVQLDNKGQECRVKPEKALPFEDATVDYHGFLARGELVIAYVSVRLPGSDRALWCSFAYKGQPIKKGSDQEHLEEADTGVNFRGSFAFHSSPRSK